jgi:hypothetical protein
MHIVEHDPPDWEDFEAAAKRPIEQHIRNSFIKTYGRDYFPTTLHLPGE